MASLYFGSHRLVNIRQLIALLLVEFDLSQIQPIRFGDFNECTWRESDTHTDRHRNSPVNVRKKDSGIYRSRFPVGTLMRASSLLCLLGPGPPWH
ncbi:unnamed protein product [Protopolystoma xenopodis]|uniref:Uncharacterized protein n=1 Tax=Protopolystoma xenopodis TaxID=117903 RepID=A0A3S5CV84_9PLAT|nr:unnamed protein product [Protopolystoma xenopodis]